MTASVCQMKQIQLSSISFTKNMFVQQQWFDLIKDRTDLGKSKGR